MSEIKHLRRAWKPHGQWAVCLVAAALVSTGCATAPEPEVTEEDLANLEQRVHDVERTNGRLMVRLEETERQVARVRDRAESNRIALQRHGHLRDDRRATAIPNQQQQTAQQRPDPAPESNYRREQGSRSYQADPTLDQRMQRRGGTRIQLSDQQSGVSTSESQRESSTHSTDRAARAPSDAGHDQEEIVITNEDLEARFGPSRSSGESPPPSTSSSDGGSDGSTAHAPVTSERLPTTDELEYPGQAEKDQREESTTSTDDGAEDFTDASRAELMALYQDSLAQYRAGDFTDALQGFTSFLNADPRQDYVDNALYWIGECHYGLGDYDASVEHFQRIIDELPHADKVPDAMLKMSLAYNRLGKSDQSVKLMEELIERYPSTNPARLAEERLEEFSE